MIETEHNKLWNAYFYPGTDILINYYGCHDKKNLKELESTETFERLLELQQEPLQLDFNSNHLKELHKYVFGNIYPFAGEYRKVNMRKRIGTFLPINSQEDIERYLTETFNKVNILLKECRSKSQFSEILAKMYTDLIYCHPFREGNGRTVREFVREFSISKSKELGIGELELDWKLINKEELNQNLEIAHIYPGTVSLIFNQALVDINTSRKTR